MFKNIVDREGYPKEQSCALFFTLGFIKKKVKCFCMPTTSDCYRKFVKTTDIREKALGSNSIITSQVFIAPIVNINVCNWCYQNLSQINGGFGMSDED